MQDGSTEFLRATEKIDVAEVLADQTRQFFQSGGITITFSQMDKDRFFADQQNSPWRMIFNMHDYGDGKVNVSVELVSRDLPITDPKFIRIEYELGQNPPLQTAVDFKEKKDLRTKSFQDFLAGVVTVMEREAPRIVSTSQTNGDGKK